MSSATLSPTPLSATSSGTVVIPGTWLFDFETGLVTTDQRASDVFWEQMTNTTRQLVPWNGAGLHTLGLVPFESLGFFDLVNLPYSANPIPGNDFPGDNSLINNSVFAVRTRSGKLVKVQVTRSASAADHSLQIRWETCVKPVTYLDVKVTLGSVPDWLVAQYAVECTYTTPAGVQEIGKALYGPAGGTLQGQISDQNGSLPSAVLVTVTINFQAGTGLQGIAKNFTPPVTDTGVNFLFQPYDVLQKTDVFFDLQPTPNATDYLLVRWKHNAGGNVVASGQTYLSGDDLRKQPVTQCEIIFVPDPVSAQNVKIEIEGRYQNQSVPLFTQTYDLSDKAVLIRAQKAGSGLGYTLISV